jgi:hypothetical protein
MTLTRSQAAAAASLAITTGYKLAQKLNPKPTEVVKPAEVVKPETVAPVHQQIVNNTTVHHHHHYYQGSGPISGSEPEAGKGCGGLVYDVMIYGCEENTCLDLVVNFFCS